MSNEIWALIITAIVAPNIGVIITHFFPNKGIVNDLNEIKKAANGTLTHLTDKKEAAESKLEKTKDEQIISDKAEIAALKEKVALLTTPPKDH